MTEDEQRAEAWVQQVGADLGVPVADIDVAALWDLTRDVAYRVARPAAPLSLFLAGYALAAGNHGTLPEVLETIAAMLPPEEEEG